MGGTSTERAVADARSVAGAAAALLRAVQDEPHDIDAAVDRLEIQASLAVGDSVAHFDSAGDGEPTAEDLLANALAQLSIGVTMISAESAVSAQDGADRLNAAVSALEHTADAVEAGAAPALGVQRFDTRPGGVLLSIPDAALAALDEMAAAAANVATAVLDSTFKPIVDKVPQALRDLVTNLAPDVPGRLARWGLRAVRRGLDLLLSLVNLPALERARAQVDGILARLGHGEDPAVLAGWAIGVADVRAALARSGALTADDGQQGELVSNLAGLADRFAGLCALLRRIAVVVAGIGGTLALLQVTLPHALAVTTAGLILVLGTLVALGRDYTGANDLPGKVRGVRLLVLDDSNAS